MDVPGLDGEIVSLAPLDAVTDEYLSWLRDPETIRYTEVSGTDTWETAAAYIAAANNDPNAALWRILERGHHVGNIRLSDINWRHRRAEVALLIGRPYWGRGIATQAIELVSRHAFEGLDLHKLTAGILAPNVRSRRAFEKAGYAQKAVLPDHALVDGAFVDSLLMVRIEPLP